MSQNPTTIRIPDDVKAEFQASASQEGMSFAAWIIAAGWDRVRAAREVKSWDKKPVATK